MNLSKKGLLALPLAALLFTSCAKSINYDEALQFVKDNFTAKEVKSATSIVYAGKGTAKDDESKKALQQHVLNYWHITLDDSLVYNHEDKNPKDVPVSFVTAESFEKAYKDNDSVEFSRKGKELSIIESITISYGTYTLTGISTTVCNGDGYKYKYVNDESYRDSKISYTWSYTRTYNIN